MKLAEKLTGIKAAGIDPVLSLLVELQTVRLIVEWIDEAVGGYSEDDLLADPEQIGFGEAARFVHNPREMLDISLRWHKLYADLNAQVVKLGLKSRQLDQSREQASMVYGLFQTVLADPGLNIPQSIRTSIRVALAERLRGVAEPSGGVHSLEPVLSLESALSG